MYIKGKVALYISDFKCQKDIEISLQIFIKCYFMHIYILFKDNITYYEINSL